MKLKNLSVVFLAFGVLLSGCNVGSGESENVDHHEHTYSQKWTYDENYHWHAATCEHKDEISNKEPHQYNDIVVSPTYDSGGYTTHTCTVCGYSYVDNNTDQLQHHYASDWSHDASSHWHACTDSGYEHLKADETPHTFKDVVTDPTYTSGGYTTHTCTICGYTYRDSETDKLEHHFSSEWTYGPSSHWHACIDGGYETLKDSESSHIFTDTIVKPATYEYKGEILHSCTVCNYSYITEIDKLEHNYSWEHNISGHWGICVDEGYETLSTEIMFHNFVDTVVDIATNESKGHINRACSICGYSYVIEIDASHNYSDTWEKTRDTHWHRCTDVGCEHLITNKAPHKFVYSTTLQRDYDRYGSDVYLCSECGYMKQINFVEPLTHSFNQEWSHNNENHWHSCKDDGYHDVKDTFEEHDFKIINKTEHTADTDGKVTKQCSICGFEKEEIYTRHNFINGACSICGVSLVDLCNNSLGELYFAKYTNGENLVNLYSEIKNFLSNIYLDTSIEYGIIGFDYAKYGLSNSEASAVVQRIILDCPIFYFLSGQIFVNSEQGIIGIGTNPEYRGKQERIKIQKEIDDFINYFETYRVDDDPFNTILMAHDYILDCVDYAYDGSGQPESAAFAHTLVGVIENEGAVCEGYSKAFQLVCDYYDIPCLVATGKANLENHAWNAVNVDNEWYWIDLTWDDVFLNKVFPGNPRNPYSEIDYRNTFENKYDYFLVDDSGFLNSHNLFTDSFNNENPFMYSLAQRSDKDYLSVHNTKLFNRIENCGIVYQILGFNKLSVAEIKLSGDVDIPASVSYGSIDYEVISIGSYYTGNVTVYGSEGGHMYSYFNSSFFVLNDDIKTLNIPASVNYIYEGSLTSAFSIFNPLTGFQNHISEFKVDENNPNFCSIDGVIYTKDLKSLVAYPFDSEKEEHVIPSTVIWIEPHSFNGIFKNLKRLYFSKDLCRELTNDDEEYYYFSSLVYFGWHVIKYASAYLGLTGGRVYMDENNENFVVYEDILYTKAYLYKTFFGDRPEDVRELTALFILDCTKESYHIPSTIDVDGEAIPVNWIYLDGIESVSVEEKLIFGSQYSLFYYLQNAKSFTFDVNYLYFDGYCVYYADTVLYVRNDLDEIVYTSTLDGIGRLAFDWEDIKSIRIPKTVTKIGDYAFGSCKNLTDIYYEGTMEEWFAIEFEDGWDRFSGEYVVHCSNGDIAKQTPEP